MTDVRLYQAADGGEVAFVNGQPVTSDGLETAVYLSLFGGEEQDGGGDDTASRQWWANLSEPDPARRYRSETQYLLLSVPAIPFNLRRIEDAVVRDLAWMTEQIATSVRCSVSIPGVNLINILIDVEIDGQVHPFAFTEDWRASA